MLKENKYTSCLAKKIENFFCAEVPPFLRACHIYIRDSQLNRPESVSLASLARQLYNIIVRAIRAIFVLITRKVSRA